MSPVEIMKDADEFVKKNIVHCSQEILQWRGTGILVDGYTRTLAHKLASISASNALGMAERLIETAALKEVASWWTEAASQEKK